MQQGFFHGIERARPDIAVNDADAAEDDNGKALARVTLVRGRCRLGRGGVFAADHSSDEASGGMGIMEQKSAASNPWPPRISDNHSLLKDEFRVQEPETQR
ncbi:hypothetical protein [Aureimonas ureilytica]|uniref:hypothetical protein n=1 Tax=Aureimonas ureilytica TaxID=401562 RepID=UPI001FCD4D40|nr:hypothetical protein [Aureimonas ureilytica]